MIKFLGVRDEKSFPLLNKHFLIRILIENPLSQVYPQSLRHDPKGRMAVVCGDGEYIIYTVSSLHVSFGIH